MTKTLSMASCENYNLNANEGFVIFWTSKLNIRFIDSFTLKMKSQLIVYLLNESEHIYRIVDLEIEVHSIWVMCTNTLKKCRAILFFEVGRNRQGAWTSSRQ